VADQIRPVAPRYRGRMAFDHPHVQMVVSSRIYQREDFKECHGAAGNFYCPGCNASADDYDLPSIGCPCEKFSSGTGSLSAAQVEHYLSVVGSRS
jgi:hypothetical protein